MRTQKRVQKIVLYWSQIRHGKFFWRYKKILQHPSRVVALWVLTYQMAQMD